MYNTYDNNRTTYFLHCFDEKSSFGFFFISEISEKIHKFFQVSISMQQNIIWQEKTRDLTRVFLQYVEKIQTHIIPDTVLPGIQPRHWAGRVSLREIQKNNNRGQNIISSNLFLNSQYFKFYIQSLLFFQFFKDIRYIWGRRLMKKYL